jgi:hypothetical protein
MTNSNPRQSHPINQSSLSDPAEADLFNALVDSEDVRWELRHPVDASVVEVRENPQSKIAYPWNPAAAESAAYLQQLEAAELLNCFEPSELDQQAHNFFTGLDQIWEKSLQTTLARKFPTVPQAILAQIATQAAQVAKSGNSLLDQLADCVQATLPQWNLEDLQVLARPMAYAMRGEETPVSQKDWADLSETERAKLTIAIARYALNQLEH